MATADANKTRRTQMVTDAAARWLAERGFKPVETEVAVSSGWVADVASFCYPTRTEAQALKLLSRRPKSDSSQLEYNEWNRRFKLLPSPLTALVEVKTSISDFRGDRKWNMMPPTHLRYVAAPLGMLDADNLPAGWGLLSVDSAGRVHHNYHPQIHSITVNQTLNVVAQVAIRRDHFTSKSRFREMRKQHNERCNTRQNLIRVSRAVEMVCDIITGKRSAEEALEYYLSSRQKLPGYLLERLKELTNGSDKH